MIISINIVYIRARARDVCTRYPEASQAQNEKREAKESVTVSRREEGEGRAEWASEIK